MSREKSVQSEPQDGCPPWATMLIGELRRMEVVLGNIPDTEAWQSTDLDQLEKRLDEGVDEDGASDTKTEILFQKISIGLAREGFVPDEIATFVNTRVFYKGGPKYCNAQEVADVLALAK